MRRSQVSIDLLAPKSISKWACNSVERVLHLQCRSRRFESCQVHQFVRVIRSGSYDLIAGPTEIGVGFLFDAHI